MQAILAGNSWEQLPAERIHDLSGVIGNAALVELMAARDSGPVMATRPLPESLCSTVPAETAGLGAPLTAQAPAFGTMGALTGGQPLVT